MSVEGHLVRMAQGWVGDGPGDLIKLCLFDWAVCAIAGQGEPVARNLLSVTSSNGGCSVFGGDTYDPPTAALINGTMGHALDYDDTHFDHIGHTSAVVMPAVLAVAQEHQSPFADVIAAATVGSEAAVRVGLWLGRDHYQIGFHQTATAGAFGATVALARLLRLSRAEVMHALGLTATMASGLKGQFGTMGKPLNAGLAARVAVEAVTWARAGVTSDPAGLRSFGASHHGQADPSAFDDDEPWKIRRVSHKFHACCHGLHAMLEALRDVDVPVAQIEKIRIETHPRWLSVCNQMSPDTGLGVKFSYRHTAAMALHGIDTARIQSFSDDIARQPALVAFRDRVEVLGNAELSETETRVHVNDQPALSHDLATPLTYDTRKARLITKAQAVIGASLTGALWAAFEAGDFAAVFDVN